MTQKYLWETISQNIAVIKLDETLTSTQKRRLELIQNGYGRQTIASTEGVHPRSVTETMKELAKRTKDTQNQ